MTILMQRFGLVYLSLFFEIKDILHKNGVNTIDERYQTKTYRNQVPYYVKVTDSYDEVYKEEAELPCVVLDTLSMNESGLQIGGGYKNFRNYDIDIYCKDDTERDTITTIIYENLDSNTYVRDFNISFPEYIYDTADGLIKETFSGPVPNTISELIVDNKTVEYLPRVGPGDVDSHRAAIRVRTLDLR